MIAKSVLRAQARWGSALALSVACLAAVLPTRVIADVVDYQYDELGRLRTVIQDDGRVTSYTLDSAGNRSNVVTAVASIIQFSTPTFSVDEAGVTATITVKRTGTLTGAVGVTYATANGTATAGSDYTATTNTLSWGDGDSVDRTFTVTIANDTTQEPSETIHLMLRLPTGTAVLGALSTATLTITDDDTPVPGTLQFSAPTFSVGEGGGNATITITRSGGTGGEVGVSFATTSGGSATAGADYTVTNGTRTWGNGIGGSQTFTVPILDDGSVESSETVNLTLSAPTGGATLGAQSSAQLTITDNDFAPPSFSISSASVNEGGTATLTVTKSGTTAAAFSVSYASSGGTAIANTDYTALPLTQLTFQPSEVTKTITVNAASDSTYEGNETYNVVLQSPTGGATISSGTGVVTINDTNTVTFSVAAVSGFDSAGSMTLTITKTGATLFSHSVSYQTLNGTATAGADYTAVNGTQTFSPGQTTATVVVPLLGDFVYEGPDETFILRLSNATGGATIPTPDSTHTLIELSRALFAVSDVTYNEGAGTVAVTITKSGTTLVSHEMTYTNVGGTATPGADYVPLSGTVTFAPSETSKTFPLTISEDALVESNETILVGLSNISNRGVSNTNGTVTIADNEAANTISISDVLLEGTTGGDSTEAVYRLTTSGDITTCVGVNCSGPFGGDIGDWISPKTNMSNYQAMATNNGCLFTSLSQAFGVWFNLGTAGAQVGVRVDAEPGFTNCSITLNIRAAANPSVIIDTARINFNVWRGP